MGCTACTEPQCLYKGARYVYITKCFNLKYSFRRPPCIVPTVAGRQHYSPSSSYATASSLWGCIVCNACVQSCKQTACSTLVISSLTLVWFMLSRRRRMRGMCSWHQYIEIRRTFFFLFLVAYLCVERQFLIAEKELIILIDGQVWSACRQLPTSGNPCIWNYLRKKLFDPK